MKTRILFILLLMSLCVVGITGLQLYWNYQNYQSTLHEFKRDSNEALEKAVDGEMDLRRERIVLQFKRWLYDTSLVQITCNTKNRAHETVFTVKDTHPLTADKKGVSFSLNEFKERLDSITPAAKKIFIDHFGDIIVKEDLKKGILFFYTQRLGDSLTQFFEKSKMDLSVLNTLYAAELKSKEIVSDFIINPAGSGWYVTQPVNAALRRPYQKEMVRAGLEKPDQYFLGKMKWVIVSTLLLIVVTLLCYGYTVSTLLSQQKLNRLKDDFISNMTHELNTPLSAIQITTEALQSMQPDEARRADYLSIIAHQSRKLSALTEQILQVQRPQAPNATFRKIKITDLISQSVNDLSAQIKKANVRMDLQYTSENWVVKGDEYALKNVFVNLVDNAIKYTEGDAVVTITITKEKNNVCIMVSDNGIGIPEEYREKVFDKFFRVPKGNRHDVKGYGLGLSYVWQVIAAHRGSISVSANTGGRGTVFTTKIPLA